MSAWTEFSVWNGKRIVLAIWATARALIIGILDSYKLGFQLALIFPLLLLPAALAEFAQHGVEIKIGMFESLAAAKRLQYSGIRIGFGIFKAIVEVTTLLLIARFWRYRDSVRTALLPPIPAIAKLMLALVALFGLGFASDKLSASLSLPPAVGAIKYIVISAIQCALFFWGIGKWIGDDRLTIRKAFSSQFIYAPLLLVTLWASSYIATRSIHIFVSKVVLGQPPYIVWLLMAIDAFVIVPLSIAISGSSLFTGYQVSSMAPAASPIRNAASVQR